MKMKNFKNILLTFMALIFATNIIHAQTPQEVAQRAFKSTVLLVMEDDRGQPLSLGSGFFIDNGVIASNLHVIEGASRGYAKLVGIDTKFDINGIIAIDREHDLVLMQVTETNTPSLPLGNSDNVQTGETVFAVGNPQGLEGTFSQGIISSVRNVRSDKILQITAPISPGSSGGPVLNQNGEVIGVSVATFRSGQNLNFAIPTNYIRNLQSRTSSPISLMQSKPTTSEKSILADFGGRGTEGITGFSFIWNMTTQSYIPNDFLGEYTFSLRNDLAETVKNIQCIVIFYDSMGIPIDVDMINYYQSIPPGLAKRISGKVNGSVQKLITDENDTEPNTKVEIRILGFTF
tara:strand:+ start:867 stop:1907 length:1041 start_codon:yes stop_codon:yes gene_type:complete